MKHKILLFLTLFTITITANAQSTSGRIAGKVITSDGLPESSVTVMVKELNRTTMTKNDGTYSFNNIKPGNYTIKISQVGTKAQESTTTVTAGKTASLDFNLSENSSQLSEININAHKSSNNTPVSINKAAISPLDLPQSTGIVTSQVIQDQQAIRLGDVVKNVSGVSLTQTRGGVAETFSARGSIIGIAGSGGSIFKNGIITNTQGFPDASTLESVEVLKGSSALQYGNVSGGLVINMVTKKPRFNWGGEVSMLAGSYNQYKPTVDLYGPLSKNLAFRVIGTHEDAESYRDNVKTHRTYVNPSLLYKIGTKTDIILEGDYLKSHITPDAGVGVPNSRITITELPFAPRNRFIYPSWVYNDTEQGDGYLTINHHFNDQWKLNAIGGFQSTHVTGFGVGVPMTIAANGDWTRTLSAVNTSERDYSAQANLNGTFKTGFINHQLLVGTDVTRIVTETNTFRYTTAAGVVGTSYDMINIFDPTKYVTRNDVPAIDKTALTTASQNRFGVYAQDLISLTSKFKVLAGLRWTTQTVFQSDIFNYDTHTPSKGSAEKTDHAFSPKVAMIFQPVQNSSVYATYSNNFTINNGTDVYGNILKPSYVDQYEAGVKNEFLNGRLSANLSVYRIRNSNLSQPAVVDRDGNPILGTTTFRVLSGQTTSDGAEVDVNATLSKNFYFIAGYSHNFVRYTNTNGAVGSQVEGERLISNPANTANGSVFYTFTSYGVKGLKLGTSAFYTGAREGGNNNVVGARPGELNSTATTVRGVTTYTSSYNALIPLTGFTTVDFSAGYSIHRVSLLAKVSNIFNTLNYVVHDRYSLNPIPPRMFATTLSYKF